mgnify:CR=1 FL=1
MKRIAFVGIGVVVGAVTAVALFPAAHGANDLSAYRQLDLFSDAFERVRADYVRPVSDSELVSDAIQGMVSSLDPHSAYMDAKAFAEHLATKIDSFPRTPAGQYWNCCEASFAYLPLQTDDPQVWKALPAAAKRADVWLRME